ncbi:MAG: Rrf2 family transcriptional regulator [Acidobacteria bacterium]|nr:Rrf2 family transcriptional regulator [Acidobacteriota bacterium]
MVSQTGKYALRILGYLAGRPGEWIQGREIAAGTGIPANYLSKILNQLRKRGLVQSQKGWGGGFLLSAESLQVPIAEVVEIIEGPRNDSKCIFEMKECDSGNPCPLHSSWDRIRGEYDSMLRTTVISDLAGRKD